MLLSSHENILKVLTTFNPWWRSGAVRAEFANWRRFNTPPMGTDRKEVILSADNTFFVYNKNTLLLKTRREISWILV